MKLSRVFWRRHAVVVLLLLAAAVFGGKAAYVHAKAYAGQWLIASAWQQTLEQGGIHKPWRWADTWPVARLQVPGLNVDQLVLASDSGQALAFGPGHNSATTGPGDSGVVVISGHRDTHFRFMKNLAPGQLIQLTGARGDVRDYRVTGHQRVDTRQDLSWNLEGALDQLVLVTCWPFNGNDSHTPWRYLVFALPENQISETYLEAST
ncbi:MAG: class GN sortase [Porticoccaceae bacterium]|nr:class GN sortase [Porticoccaceae bacterium]